MFEEESPLHVFEFTVKMSDVNPTDTKTYEELYTELHIAEMTFMAELLVAQDTAPIPVYVILIPWALDSGIWKRRAMFIPARNFIFTRTKPDGMVDTALAA